MDPFQSKARSVRVLGTKSWKRMQNEGSKDDWIGTIKRYIHQNSNHSLGRKISPRTPLVQKTKVWVLQNSLCDLSFYPPNKNIWDAHVNSIGDKRAKWEASAQLWIPQKIAGNNDQYKLLLPLDWKLSFFNFCSRRSQQLQIFQVLS